MFIYVSLTQSHPDRHQVNRPNRHSPVASAWILAAAVVALTAPQAISAQAVQASQSATVSQWLAEAHIEIVYDRPVARGREVWGSLVPWNEVWTPSANLALQLKTSADMMFAGQHLPAGDYSVWLEPRPSGAWRVLVHESLMVAHNVIPEDGWVLEAEVTPRSAEHMEALAVYFFNADRREGTLDIHWSTLALRIPLQVPEPGGQDPR